MNSSSLATADNERLQLGDVQSTQYDWAFETTAQPGLYNNGTDGAQPVPRGKTLGGTSAMNWMIHNEDSRIQLDIWESICNATGWNWKSLSTAFRESETMFAPPPSEAADLPYIAANHGASGPICSIFQRSVLSLFPDYLEPTLLAAGFQIPEDRNGGDAVGGGFLPLAICPSNYTRSYSGSAYTAVENRSNLHVITEAQVTKIIWQSTSGSATAAGLEYVTASGTTNQILGREVILSAGCIQSAQILELSGVGDPSILNPLGIDTVVNLPNVGRGLRDPPMTNYMPIHFEINTTLTGGEYVQNFIQLEPASKMLSPQDYAGASAWLNATPSIPGLEDVQLQVFKELWYTDQPLIELAWQYNTTNVTPYALVPLSQGSVHIQSNDPLIPPTIDPNYNSINATINGVEVPFDMWFLAKSAQSYTRQLATIAPMSSIVVSTDPAWDLPFEDYYDLLFQRTGSSQHLTGTNPMLPMAAGGVVDTNLLVYGTSNVRIVDGSIFPYQPSAHPMGLTYAVAVRAARLFQGLPNGGGLTYTELLPGSNSSANATAVFSTSPPLPTLSMFTGGSGHVREQVGLTTVTLLVTIFVLDILCVL